MDRLYYLMAVLLLFILTTNNTLAENNIVEYGKIKGKVVDAQNGEALPGANILIEHTTVGASSTLDGSFKIVKAPTGKIKITASLVGYKRESFEIELKADQIKELNFELKEGMFEMGSVVVTGTGTPHLYEDMPVKTEIVTKKLIQQCQAINLSEAMNFQTGVRVENACQNCNFTQVRILGFDGKYSQVLIDGDPVVSSLGGVYGLEHFPREMIEQLEIVKGGGSALYGGGAISGTVNLITRRPAFNKTKANYSGYSLEGTMDHNIGVVSELVNESGTSGAFIFGSVRRRNPYDRNGDSFTELGKIRHETIGFNWYYRPVTNGELLFSFNRIHEERRGGTELDKPLHESEISESIEHYRWGGKLKWTHRTSALFDYDVHYAYSIIDRVSYFGGLGGDTPEDRLAALKLYGKSYNPLHVVGAKANYRTKNNLISAGIQYSSDKLKDETVANPTYHIDENFTNLGIFLQDNIHFGKNDQFEVVVGARADKHSEISDWIFSPRLNLKYNLSDDISLRAAFTTGFKAPQIYDEDLHICGLEGDQKVIQNSANLGAEKSKTFSAGAEYQDFVGDVALLLGVTGFYTKLDDAFSERFVRAKDHIQLWERINSSGASIKGVEFDLGFKPFNTFEVRGGFTIKSGEFEEVNEDFNTKEFLRSPETFGYLRTSFDYSKNLNLFAAARFTGESKVPHEIPVEGQEDPLLKLENGKSFLEFDLGVTYKLPFVKDIDTEISFGVKNLTNEYQEDLDKTADRDPAYVYGPSLPRTIYFGISTSF